MNGLPARFAPAQAPAAAHDAALRLVRTHMRASGEELALFVNAASGRAVTDDWFKPQYWVARDAVFARHRGRGAAIGFEHDGARFLLRHYLRGGLAAALSTDRYLWLGEARARPLRELKLTLELHAAGLPVAQPIAARYRRAGWHYRADLITGYLPGTRTLAARVLTHDVPPATWAAVGSTLRRFHQWGLDHADLNAHNILVRGVDEVFVVDFDRARRRTREGFWPDANLARLRRSLDALEDGQRVRHFGDAQWHTLLTAWLAADLPG